jgi:chromosome segregation ATPase
MSSLSVVELGARVDALSARAEVESKAVSTTFTEMRSFVSESVGTLRREMIRRFDALDKRLTGVETRLGRVEKRLDGLEQRFDRLEIRFEGLEQRFSGLEKRFDGLEKRFDGLEERFDGFERQSARIESKLDQLLSARPAKARRTRRR